MKNKLRTQEGHWTSQSLLLFHTVPLKIERDYHVYFTYSFCHNRIEGQEQDTTNFPKTPELMNISELHLSLIYKQACSDLKSLKE